MSTSQAAATLTYLEHDVDAPELVVLLHGLGMDAGDFAGFLARREVHAVAPTLLGFEPPAGAGPSSVIDPVALDTHVHLLVRFLAELRHRHPDKPMTLIGFSLGADLCLRLAEYWQRHAAEQLDLRAIMLLDPNMNHATMTISHLFAIADPADPLAALRAVVGQATTVTEFGALCGYLSRVAAKDFRQIQHHARDFVRYWPPAGHYDPVTRRLGVVSALADRVRVTCSASYAMHFGVVESRLRSAGVHNVTFKLTELDHFDLIHADVLAAEVASLRHTALSSS